jgi:phosphoadenosine phosphosulfate reductase
MSHNHILQNRIDTAVALLQRIEREHAPAAFANSLGAEDMVLTDLIVRHAPGIEVFTLDTGRLHDETYRLMQQVADHYDIRLRVYFPRPESVERYASEHGINAFYQSVELRKACCHARKVEPLSRALAGKAAWITGLRRAQAVTRADLPEQEHDAAHGIPKFNPLAAWSEKEVWDYIRTFAVPYNELHERGYPSIGCAPCTRALAVGEDVRAGRWWWESPATKECGLHLKPAFGGTSSQANIGSADVKAPSGAGRRQDPRVAAADTDEVAA